MILVGFHFCSVNRQFQLSFMLSLPALHTAVNLNPPKDISWWLNSMEN